MADRDYKVVYKSRIRPVDDQPDYDYHRERRYESDRRDRYYEDDYRRPPDDDRRYGRRENLVRDDVVDRRSVVERNDYGRDIYRDRDRERERERDLALTTRPRQSTRTEYDFLSDRDDVYTRSTDSNVIVLDSRDRGDGGLTEWEIIRPEKTESGAIIIDADDLRAGGRGYGYDGRAHSSRGLEVVVASSGRGRDRSVGGRSIVDAMREVRVTEEVDDDRRSVYGRSDRRSRVDVVPMVSPDAPRRVATALRHDHSPSSDTRRRSRSIGFHRSQISHHDASERKHERPGAEAANAGRYLIDHRGERIDVDDFSYAGSGAGRDRSRRRRKHRSYKEEDYEYERKDRYYENERHINDTFEERSRPYSPQRALSPESDTDEKRKHRKHRRHRSRRRREEKDVDVDVEEEDDDRKSYYSEHYRKTKREYND